MNENGRYVLGVVESHVGPCRTAVVRSVNTIPKANMTTTHVFPGTYPNRVGVRRIDSYIANRIRRLIIEDGGPRHARILSFPDPARPGRNIPNAGVLWIPIYIGNTT